MSTAILARPVSDGWIISKRDDLFWFIGSGLAGYVALLALAAGFPLLTAFLVWNLAIDGPHVFATASRTYFDKQARARLGWKLWLIIPMLLLGPVMWSIGLTALFVAFSLTWAQFHIAKQHLGFVMLYKRKTGEHADFGIDRRFVVISLMLPWVIFLYALFGLPATFKVTTFAVILYAPLALLYVAHQVRKRAKGEVCNAPKLLLLAVVIPLHWIALLYAGGRAEGMIIAGIVTNLGHSLQYQRLTWFHNRNRYADKAQFGLASVVSGSALIFFLTAAFLNLIFWAMPHYALSSNLMLLTLLAGMNMTHYYLDSQIWRVRSDRELSSALNL